MTETRHRGACPRLSAPMPTGDGLLARLTPAAAVPLDAMAGFCAAASRHGNGIVEISARGSLQVRGLTPYSAPLFADAVGELGIEAQDGVPVIAAFDDGAADLLAAELRRVIATARLALSPKVSVVVDGDGPLHLDGLQSDVRLRIAPAAGHASAPRFFIGINGYRRDEYTTSALPRPPQEGENRGEGRMQQGQVGRCERILEPDTDSRRRIGFPLSEDSRPACLTPTLSALRTEREHAAIRRDVPSTTWLGTVASKDAAAATLRVLAIIAAHGPAARATDLLTREGVAGFHGIAAVDPGPAPPSRTPADMIGLHAMRDGAMALGVGLVFGHTRANALAELVRVAALRGVRAMRAMPDRAMLLTGVSALNARALITAAERLGFVVRADDPRRRIAACPGAPACASGMIPARALAWRLIPFLAPVLRSTHDGVVLHISGCPKGCAHPEAAVLTVVGTPNGCGVVRFGTARDAPDHIVDPAHVHDEIARLPTRPAEAAHD